MGRGIIRCLSRGVDPWLYRWRVFYCDKVFSFSRARCAIVERFFTTLRPHGHSGADHGGVAEDAGRRIEALTAARNILLNQRSA